MRSLGNIGVNNVIGAIKLRRLDDTAENRAAVNTIYAECADYTQLIEGRAPNDGDGEEFFTSVPPGYAIDDLDLFGLESDGTLIGVASLLRRWNWPHKTHIGLLLIRPSGRGQHAGAAAVALLEAFVRTLPGMTVMRLAVVASNVDAFSFWRKMGFVETGEVKPKSPPYLADVVVMEKLLVPRDS